MTEPTNKLSESGDVPAESKTLAIFKVASYSIGEDESGMLCRGYFREQRYMDENKLIKELALSPEYVDDLKSESGPHGDTWLVVTRVPHLSAVPKE